MKFLKIFEKFNTNDINTESDLISKLIDYSVPVDCWGTGSSKNVRHLLKEILEEECEVVEEGGYLVRYIEFVGVRVYYRDKNSEKWALVEDRQEFKDGRVRERNMQSSVSEKMKFGEDPVMSAIRGVEEELGIEISESQLLKRRDIFYDQGSMSYPGLKTKYKGHQFTCWLNDSQFDKDGYVEEQEDKSTFFKWIKR